MATGIQFTAAGEARFLSNNLGTTAAEAIIEKLYTACASAGGIPGQASLLGDFTEATFTGYSAKTLALASWPTPSGTPAASSYPQQTWTNGGASGQTILGYYWVGAVSGMLYGAEAWAASVVLNAGATMTHTPSFRLGSNPAPTS